MLRPSSLVPLLLNACLSASAPVGYYRQPTLAGETLVFVAEGDLWTVPAAGGSARRLTAHPGSESRPCLSPDGKLLAFNACYEGPSEVYTMPLEGGAPTRRTFQGGGAAAAGWTPSGRLMIASRNCSPLGDPQLLELDLDKGAIRAVPLAQAAEGAWNGSQLVFTRYAPQWSFTKRYRGGTTQNLWSFREGDEEARPLTPDFPGTSRNPMVWQGRVIFVSDRDGTQNLWSMDAAGKDLRQLTFHKGWDIQGASLSGGRVAYQLGADLRLFELTSGTDRPIPITLASDLDHRRERWVGQPLEYLTQAHLSPQGDRVALTLRGHTVVVPVEAGRIVEPSRAQGEARIREARFMPDGKRLLVLSDASGETEWWTLSADGDGAPLQLSRNAKVLRLDGAPSPDGKRLAHTDKDNRLWILDIATGCDTPAARSDWGPITDLRWSPDSARLAFVQAAPNAFPVIHVLDVLDAAAGTATAVTSDRFESWCPAWSPDGNWLYFLSARNFRSLVPTPWGLRNPEPFFDRQARIFALPLRKGLRSPFQASDELLAGGGDPAAGSLMEVPVEPGNYRDLALDGKRLYWISEAAGADGKGALQSLEIGNRPPFKPETLLEQVTSFELTRKLMARRGKELLVLEPGPVSSADLVKGAVSLQGLNLVVDPAKEWRQMFLDAWRMERDYFYDRNMHRVDWAAVRGKYLTLVDRITDREELSDLIGQMVGELSALHMFVRGGDLRTGPEQVQAASLGAEFSPAEGGWRVDKIYQGDPELPETLSPLGRPTVDVREGDLVVALDGTPLAAGLHPDLLLRNKAGRQVRLRVKRGEVLRDVIVQPMPASALPSLRCTQWELSRRQEVERRGLGRIGYVHLRAMGPHDIARWYQDFYPVAGRQGLIIDMRHNLGGNIDSWILEKLLRKAWFYWKPAVGLPYPNMPEAFGGQLAVLCDAWTASDGEAFCEGIRRLGLGKVIGTRTWGGEVWLNADNFLRDGGIATAAETGVFGPEGAWLIEGHGVDPDLVVDNLPHAAFLGQDAQLDAALAWLEGEMRQNPRTPPSVPPYPDKSSR